jgi:membrane-associated phospholipid phosphatase
MLAGFVVLLACAIVSVCYVDKALALEFAALRRDYPILIAPFTAITTLGKSQWYLVPLGCGMIALWLSARYWPHHAQQAYRYLAMAAFIFANIALSGLAVDGLKIMIGRPRPVLLLEQNIFNLFSPWILKSRWWSLPSGHTTTALSLALAVGALWPRWQWGMLFFAGVVSASRVIITAHYLGDVFSGMAMAVLIFIMLTHLFIKRGWLK